MQRATPISCTMTSSELDQASRTHFAFIEHLLKEAQARRAAQALSFVAPSENRLN